MNLFNYALTVRLVYCSTLFTPEYDKIVNKDEVFIMADIFITGETFNLFCWNWLYVAVENCESATDNLRINMSKRLLVHSYS